MSEQDRLAHAAVDLSVTPSPPYFAVIFTSIRGLDEADAGYAEAAQRMIELAAQQEGFLGVDSARGADGLGITVSYWESESAIARWKAHGEHSLVRERGRRDWYQQFEVRIARVERAYGNSKKETAA